MFAPALIDEMIEKRKCANVVVFMCLIFLIFFMFGIIIHRELHRHD